MVRTGTAEEIICPDFNFKTQEFDDVTPQTAAAEDVSQACVFFLPRQYNRLRNLIKDPRHDCVMFSNEFQEHCYCPREKGESLEQWQTR